MFESLQVLGSVAGGLAGFLGLAACLGVLAFFMGLSSTSRVTFEGLGFVSSSLKASVYVLAAAARRGRSDMVVRV